MKPNYKKGFELLMSYWDCFPDEEKDEIHQQLKEMGL